MIEMENQRGENDRFLNRSDHQLLKIEDVDPKILYVHVPSKRMFVTLLQLPLSSFVAGYVPMAPCDAHPYTAKTKKPCAIKAYGLESTYTVAQYQSFLCRLHDDN